MSPTRLEPDEVRDLAELVIATGFRELVFARTCVRAISEERTCSERVRLDYVVKARGVLHDLEHAAEFYRGAGLDQWTSVLNLTDGVISAIREKYEREAAPIRAALREGLARVGASIDMRGR